MITKKQKFGKHEVTLLEFGNGTIHVQSAMHKEGFSSVLFKTADPTPIGTEHETKGMTSDEYNPEVVMVFRDKDSIDVVVEKLKQSQLYLNGEMNTTPEEKMVDENCNFISAFIDHVKEKTGFTIPDNVFESFFNA